jgi:thymidine phosphorylase
VKPAMTTKFTYANSDLRRRFLVAKPLGIDTQQEAVVFMHQDCGVCRSEGFTAHARVKVTNGASWIIATLYRVSSDLVRPDHVGLSNSAWARLALKEGDLVSVTHPEPVESLSSVRSKIYGHRIGAPGMSAIIGDIVAGRYSDNDLAAFTTACAAAPLDRQETISLTRAMVESGDRLDWGSAPILDKHSVGGLPGNRTTPIVVSIVAACGLTMPKTSSRAITSPAGTADAMETLAPVNLSLTKMREVVEAEGACIAWGGAVRLSPADDILIGIERALDIDSEGQLVASVLSKKIAAGSTHLVLDMPVGPTAKVRTPEAAKILSDALQTVASEFGLTTRVILGDGTQPVGRGIGPALEAHDVLAVLQGKPNAPEDLRNRSLELASAILDLTGRFPPDVGAALAAGALADGRAWRKFQRICEAQGGMRLPPVAPHHMDVVSPAKGIVRKIDLRRLAKAAKLAGAPEDKAAGAIIQVRLGDPVERGQPLFTLHAEAPGELDYALDYARANADIVSVWS